MTMQQWDEHTHAPRTWEEYLDRAIEMAVERAIFGGNEIARLQENADPWDRWTASREYVPVGAAR